MWEEALWEMSSWSGCWYSCVKDGHKLRDCPNIAARGNEGKKVPPNVSGNDDPKKSRFYALWSKRSKTDDEDDVGK